MEMEQVEHQAEETEREQNIQKLVSETERKNITEVWELQKISLIQPASTD